MKQQTEYHHDNRCNWEQHLLELSSRGNGSFMSMYRMSYSSFMILSSLLHDKIPRQRNSSVTTIMKLHCLLRWLSGGSHHDIMVNMGVCKSTLYNIIDQCMIDIVTCDELEYHFPSSIEEISNDVYYWNYCSEVSVITVCVVFVDLFFLKINNPSKNETPNGKDYFQVIISVMELIYKLLVIVNVDLLV